MSEEWFDNESSNVSELLIRRFVDGEPVNKNPLTKIPESEMKLYTVHGVLSGEYFDDISEFNSYINSNNNLNSCDVGTVEYLRECAGKCDVIKFTSFLNGMVSFYAMGDQYGYCMYNNERSIYRGECTWEYFHGTLCHAYRNFRDRGIVFEDDMYPRIERKNKQLYKKMKKIFNRNAEKVNI